MSRASARMRIGVVSGVVCGAALLFASGSRFAALSPLAVIFMLGEFTGGWRALAISLVLFCAASLVIPVPVLPVMLTATAAFAAARAMRVALPVSVPVLVIVTAGIGHAVIASGGAPPPAAVVARALLEGCVNVALAVMFSIAAPRSLVLRPPLPRWRMTDLLLPGSAAAFAAAVLLGGWWYVAAIVAVLALVESAGFVMRRTTARLRAVLRDGRVRMLRQRSGRLPRELALVFLAARRVTDRLHRQAALQGLHLESARSRVARLRQQQHVAEQERRRVEFDVQLRERRWRAFLDTVPEALVIADASGRIEYANEGLRRLLGYDPEKLVGTSLTALIPAARHGDAFDPAGLANGRAPDAAAEKSLRFSGANGTLHELSARVRPFTLSSGRYVGIRLREAAAPTQLAHFLAKISHEIRTPLHGLMATLDLLRSERMTGEGSRRLGIARTSAKTLMRIANDVLDLTRMSAGGMSIERKAMSIDRLINEVVDEARSRDEALPLNIRSEILGDLPPAVLGDPGRIKQILRNLVSNALKFTTRGSVTVCVTWREGVCTIDVIDTGAGIPADRADSIFEAFVQAHHSRRKGGAGLGLAISRQLSEAMGGNLTLRQSSPRGSTFRLVLPLAATDESPLDEQSQRNLPAMKSRILVAEDDEASRYVAEALLESLQCPARVVANGREALEVLEREEFDLILLDCDMPELDGYEVTARIRARGGRHIPIIAMTASTMAADRQRCFDAGMDDLLSKPFSRGGLGDMLAKWLVPGGAGAAQLTLAQEITTRPEIDAGIFEELRRSLNWQLPPLRKIYQSIPDSAQKAIDALATPGAEPEQLYRRLHSLQGGAGLVGARQIELIAARLTHALKEERATELGEGLPHLREALRRFEDVLGQRLDALSGR